MAESTATNSDVTYIKITGANSIQGQQYRWQYKWVEQEYDGSGFRDKPGGRSSTATGIYAYNTIEANSQVAWRGSMVLPVGGEGSGAGTPVVAAVEVPNAQGQTEMAFQYVNATPDGCQVPAPHYPGQVLQVLGQGNPSAYGWSFLTGVSLPP